jgi:hypothetical protein
VTTILLAAGLLAPPSASAYTLVLKAGGRVDVGDAYRLDGSSVEYRADGAVRRVALADVDLQATARANNETVAAFVNRASRPRVDAPAVARVQVEAAHAPVSVTNADLEPYRVEREQLDAEYYARHPEARYANAEPVADAALPVATDVSPYDEEQWRSQARLLREQAFVEEQQIAALRDEIATRQDRPFDYALSYRYNFGRAPIIFRGGQFYSLSNPLYPSLRADEELSQLNSRLIDLEIQYRATRIRLDDFLERARRAGVPPGWLRD